MELGAQLIAARAGAWRGGRRGADIDVNHLHIDTIFIRRDLNVALPLDRLRELVRQGVVGSIADPHYSTMGYQGSSIKVLETDPDERRSWHPAEPSPIGALLRERRRREAAATEQRRADR
jgi:hypothetical protein